MAKGAERPAGEVSAIKAAVEEVCGAAMVLDSELRVVLVTSLAEGLAGNRA